jgi:hypothetical protein
MFNKDMSSKSQDVNSLHNQTTLLIDNFHSVNSNSSKNKINTTKSAEEPSTNNINFNHNKQPNFNQDKNFIITPPVETKKVITNSNNLNYQNHFNNSSSNINKNNKKSPLFAFAVVLLAFLVIIFICLLTLIVILKLSS